MQKTLNPRIWKNNKLKPGIRKKLLLIAYSFIKELDVKDLDIEDICFLGSNANFDYHDKSDIDVHIMVNLNNFADKKEILKKYLLAKKAIWSSVHNIKVKGYNVEVYPEDIDDKQSSTGKFSLLNNKWIIKPNINNDKIDTNLAKKKIKSYTTYINFLEKLSNEKGVDIESIIEKLDSLKDKLKNDRKCGIYTNGIFSIENLIFKGLRNNGSLEKLTKLRNSLFDKNLTLEKNINR